MTGLYYDSSAIVKLIRTEPETRALLDQMGEPLGWWATSALARTEVVRAVWSGGRAAVTRARVILHSAFEVVVTRSVLDRAADLDTGTMLRTVDAIHLASALSLRREIDGLVTYDRRMAEAAEAIGLPVVAPA